MLDSLFTSRCSPYAHLFQTPSSLSVVTWQSMEPTTFLSPPISILDWLLQLIHLAHARFASITVCLHFYLSKPHDAIAMIVLLRPSCGLHCNDHSARLQFKPPHFSTGSQYATMNPSQLHSPCLSFATCDAHPHCKHC